MIFSAIATAATQNSVIWALFAAPRAEEKHMAITRKHIHVHDNTNNTSTSTLDAKLSQRASNASDVSASYCSKISDSSSMQLRACCGDDNQRALSHHGMA